MGKVEGVHAVTYPTACTGMLYTSRPLNMDPNSSATYVLHVSGGRESDWWILHSNIMLAYAEIQMTLHAWVI